MNTLLKYTIGISVVNAVGVWGTFFINYDRHWGKKNNKND